MSTPHREESGETDTLTVATQVRAERLAHLQSMSGLPAGVAAVFSLLPVALLWPHHPPALLLGWLAVRCGLSLWRYLQAQRFVSHPPPLSDLLRQERRYLGALALDGLVWGAVGVFFAVPQAPAVDGAVITALVALAALTTVSLGAWARAQALFGTFVFAPVVLRLVVQGGEVALLTATGLVMFWIVATLASRRTAARAMELLRLRFEQARLAQERQQALHAAEETSSSKSRFVAVMSHEIRTPLNGILGMAQLLERSGLPAAQREQIEVVRRSGRHLLTLVNDILDLARIEAGKLVVEAQPVDLREVVGDVTRLLGETAHAKGLTLDVYFAPQLPARALGDASRIRQVLHNLVGNAIKFSERGGVTVEVSTASDASGAALLRFAVRDTGEGIAPDQLERIFAPFEQAEGGRLRGREGTGLGLTISRELALAMGGELRCTSSGIGRGSEFELSLPLRACAGPAPACAGSMPACAGSMPACAGSMPAYAATVPALPTADEATTTPRTALVSAVPASTRPAADTALLFSGRVLLVDDSPVNLLVATTMLQRCGLTVETAENGLRALEKLRSRRYDLVLMDVLMPEMNGFEATRRWRQEEARRHRSRTPIVALTASAAEADHHRCLDSGMDDTLAKPFEIEELLAVTRRYLRPAASASATAPRSPTAPRPLRALGPMLHRRSRSTPAAA